MRKILEELWYGNICPNDRYYKATKEVKELMGYIADHHDNLQKTLTDKKRNCLNGLTIAPQSLRISTSVKYSYMLFGWERELPLRS